MALRTLGTNATTSLRALNNWGQNLTDADIAAMAQTITDDARIASILGGGSSGAGGILATGATHSSTTLDTLVGTGGGPIAAIQRGMVVLAADIPPGTFVADILSATSVQLSQAATGTNAERVAFVPVGDPNLSRTQQLIVPKRGVLNLLPGDLVAIDNTGWPILVSGAAVAYAGSQWTLT